MPKACDLKRGAIVAIDGAPHMIEALKISSPTARGSSSLYHFRLRNLGTRNKLDRTCKGDDMFTDCDFEKRAVQYSYAQGDLYTFMDLADYSEIVFNADDIAAELPYITEEMEGIQVLISDDKALGIELPSVATLEITECDPSMRGASATARTKPATLSTGLVVQVPEYLSPNEVIRVDTRSGAFLGRA
ncbi:MAG: elongation factor P-like protein YeiP [Verrucomicrobia bacterium]|jgi:elongation factor P|nr:elongation factor P-like protein YeiP [Verrucomicrobiota bacterium]MBT7065356.1 elongation factor P-like protein YeiP [Verrucomicrobiota bacterium]MBT7701978.1 elongation factor P-like protein YeiP [Verrucomicrobiota bacterium]